MPPANNSYPVPISVKLFSRILRHFVEFPGIQKFVKINFIYMGPATNNLLVITHDQSVTSGGEEKKFFVMR